MKKGFTLGELTITLIIITVVVIVTLPITLNKMKKVDSYSYYMGYNVAQDIWANLSSDLIPDENTSSSSDDGNSDDGDSSTVVIPDDDEPEEPEEPLGKCKVTHIDVGQDDRPIGGMTYENVTKKECDNHAADSCGYNCATDVQWTQYN